MPISSREFLSMMTSTLSANCCGGINQVCEVCFANLPGRTSRSPMIWPRKLSCVLIKTSGAFGVKPVFRHGFIVLLTIAFKKTPGDARNSLESMRNNCNLSTIPMWPILV